MFLRIFHALQRANYPVLLACLFAQFLLAPWSESGPLLHLLVVAARVLVLLASWIALRPHRVLLSAALLLGAVGIVLGYLEAGPASPAVDAAFLACLLSAILLDVFRAKRVTSDTLCGAAAIYLLVGLAWANAYRMVHLLDAGAFQGGPEAVDAPTFIYFSFVVLTTLGFGDLVPLSQEARSLTVIEALIGQLYLVVIMARLVALSLNPPGTGDEDADRSG